jgi:hypothetical protein
VIGATAPGADTYDFPLLLKELLGVNIKIVSGYSSSADARKQSWALRSAPDVGLLPGRCR